MDLREIDLSFDTFTPFYVVISAVKKGSGRFWKVSRHIFSLALLTTQERETQSMRCTEHYKVKGHSHSYSESRVAQLHEPFSAPGAGIFLDPCQLQFPRDSQLASLCPLPQNLTKSKLKPLR